MRIIDFRLRPSTPEMVSIADNPVFSDLLTKKAKPYDKRVCPVEETVKEMDEAGISWGVIQGRDIETTYKWKMSNDHVAEVVNKFPNRFIGYAGVDPNKGKEAVCEIERAVKVLGLKGVSLDPYMHWKPANDKIYYPIYEKCVELSIPVMLTTGPGAHVPRTLMWHASPVTIDEVAKDFPELIIIASHGCYPYVFEMIGVALRHDNVYFDISAYELFPGAELYVKAVNTIIPTKMFFASAHPLTHFKETIKRHEQLDYTEEVRKNVYYRNAERILNVKV